MTVSGVLWFSVHLLTSPSLLGSLMNGLQALPAWQDAFGNPVGYNLGLVNAALAFGGLVALPFCSTMSDGIGRKWTLFIGGLAIIIGSVIQAVSVNLGMFVFSRVFVGVGSMLVVQPSPMLISEICYPPHRGIYTALYWTNYYLGAIIAAWSTYGLQKSMPTSDWAWRGPSILQGGLPLLQLLLVCSHPDMASFPETRLIFSISSGTNSRNPRDGLSPRARSRRLGPPSPNITLAATKATS